MLKPDQIPDAVVKAATSTYAAEIYKGNATNAEYKAAMGAAIAAAIEAWPGAWQAPLEKSFDLDVNDLILPLPEARSADAKPQQEGDGDYDYAGGL